MSISQNLPSTRPTLNLNFARSKTLDPRITFTRSSSAIVTDQSGILRTVATNRPRFDHDPITGESLGLLVEEQRTNIVPLSNLVGQTLTYPSGTSTINTFNSLLAPDNTFTATLTDNNGNVQNYLYGGANSTLSTNTTYTYSIFVKQGTKPDFQVTIDENGFGGKRYYISFTFSTETITTGITGLTNDGDVIRSSYIKYPNGWYRLTLTFRTSTNTVGSFIDMINRFGNTAGSNYVWGRQLEVGSFPTSYIPTVPTFTSRASTATFYDSTGTLRTAASNVARSDAYFPDSSNVFRSGGLLLEAAATNLFGNSSFIQKTDISIPDNWNGWNPATFLKSQTLAPDGISYGVFHGAVNQNGGGLRTDLTGLSANTAYVVSFWARSITSSELTYFTNNNGRGTTTGTADGAANVAWFAATQARFDIQNINGTGGSGAAQFVLSTTWKRFSGSITTDSAGSIRIIISNNVSDTGTGNEDGGGVWMIWGAQLEQATNGITTTSYIPTVPSFTSRASSATYYDVNGILRTAAINEVRNNAYIPESSTVFRGPNWLVENAATNLVARSEEFNEGVWAKSQVSVTSNVTTAPNETLTADKLVEAVGTSTFYYLIQSVSGGNTTYTHSLYAKQAESDRHLYFEVGSCRVGINLSNGTVFYGPDTFSTGWSNPKVKVEQHRNGWYRCSITGTADNTVTSVNAKIHTATLTGGAGGIVYNGNGTSGIFIWGAQLETGSRATSYIPTTESTATRAADVISYPTVTRAADVFSSPSVTRSADTVTISGSNFSSFYNQSEGTVFIRSSSFSYGNAATLPTAVHFTNGTLNNYIRLNSGPSYLIRNFTNTGNVTQTQAGINIAPVNNTPYSIALGISTNNARLYVNTNPGATINPYLVPVVNKVEIGNWISQNNTYLNGHISRLAYYPVRLPDAQLQALTK